MKIIAAGLALLVTGVTATLSLGFNMLGESPAPSAPIEAAVATEAVQPGDASATVFAIDPSASEARFVIDEVLRGADFTVIGSTDQVAGQFALDVNNAPSVDVGTILINARTLETDDTSRNRALQNLILNTGTHEYISFAPTSISGLPTSMQAGQTYAAQLAGDLTISGTSRPVAFDVQLTPVSATQVTGSAATTINYADWGLNIPNVPFVASVDNDVRLEIDFTANAA